MFPSRFYFRDPEPSQGVRSNAPHLPNRARTSHRESKDLVASEHFDEQVPEGRMKKGTAQLELRLRCSKWQGTPSAR